MHRLWGGLRIHLGPALLAHQERLVQVPRLRMCDTSSAAAPLYLSQFVDKSSDDAMLLGLTNEQPKGLP